MGRKVTKKAVRFVEALASGLTPREAVVSAGYSAPVGLVLSRLKGNEAISEYVEGRMLAGGVDFPALVEKLREGLDAKVVESFCTKSGDVVYSEAMVDHQTRHKFLGTALSLLNLTGQGRAAVPVSGQQGVTVNVLHIQEKYSGRSDEELNDVLQKFQIGVLTQEA